MTEPTAHRVTWFGPPDRPTGGTVYARPPAALHGTDDWCFYCASDAELTRVLTGPDSRTVHMDTTEEQCPFWAPAAEEETE